MVPSPTRLILERSSRQSSRSFKWTMLIYVRVPPYQLPRGMADRLDLIHNPFVSPPISAMGMMVYTFILGYPLSPSIQATRASARLGPFSSHWSMKVSPNPLASQISVKRTYSRFPKRGRSLQRSIRSSITPMSSTRTIWNDSLRCKRNTTSRWKRMDLRLRCSEFQVDPWTRL